MVVRYTVMCSGVERRWKYHRKSVDKALSFYDYFLYSLRERRPDEYLNYSNLVTELETDYYFPSWKWVSYFEIPKPKKSIPTFLTSGSSNHVFQVGEYLSFKDKQLEIIKVTHLEDGSVEYLVSHVLYLDSNLEESRLESIEEWMKHSYPKVDKFEELKGEKDKRDIIVEMLEDIERYKKRNISFNALCAKYVPEMPPATETVYFEDERQRMMREHFHQSPTRTEQDTGIDFSVIIAICVVGGIALLIMMMIAAGGGS